MLGKEVGCLGKRVRGYIYLVDQPDQVEQEIVVFRDEVSQPAMLRDQASIYTARDEQHQ